MSAKDELMEWLIQYFSEVLKNQKYRPEKDVLRDILNRQFTTTIGSSSLRKDGDILILTYKVDMDKFGEEVGA